MKRTVVQMLKNAAVKYEKSKFTSEKSNEGWVSKTFLDVHNDATYFAISLFEIGLIPENKISILSEGRISWITGEFGILKLRCVSVPLSIKLLPDEILFRLNHSESKAILISKNNIDKIIPIWSKIEAPDFKLIYLDEDDETIQMLIQTLNIKKGVELFLYKELIEGGKSNLATSKSKIEKIEEEIEEEDVVTISYTSGTTGNPKGIMLTHLNYYSNSHDALAYFKLTEYFTTLVILPLDHSFAHTVGTYIALLNGDEIGFVDSRGGGVNTLKNIPINLKEFEPQFLLTVPALTGNFMKKITDAIDAKGGFIKWLFYAGLHAGIKINKEGYKKADFFTKLFNFIPYKLANALIFEKVRLIFGKKIQFCVGGGALLDIKQQKFFYTIGVPIYQGYGLTEATPIISANCDHTHKLGTSGKVLNGIECKILRTDGTEAKTGEKGEIVIRGLNVMKGYYKNQKATDEVLKNGWLYTGDMGYYDEDKFLVVVGREKALLISQDGEKYSPEEIEEAITNSSELVHQVMLYNDHSKYTSAIITLDKARVANYVKKHNINSEEKLCEEIRNSFYKFKNEDEYKNKFPEKWIPTIFRIVTEPFTEKNFMINSTMKMVRYKIVEAYREIIDEMYKSDARTLSTKNFEVLQEYIEK